MIQEDSGIKRLECVMKSDELYKIVGETALHCPIYIEHQGILYEVARTDYNPEQNNWSPQTPLILITGKKSVVQLAPEVPPASEAFEGKSSLRAWSEMILEESTPVSLGEVKDGSSDND